MGYVVGERLIGGVFYRPIDEHKGRELLQSEPEPKGLPKIGGLFSFAFWFVTNLCLFVPANFT